jgi:glutamate N-acetyltransferase/amino-acid N-acetyltransferase
MPNNTITAPKGFIAAGLKAGIKSSNSHDLAVLACPDGAKAAGVFTTSKIVSPAVTVCKKHLKSKKINAVLINSGNANACTGRQGYSDAVNICKKLATLLNIDPHTILTASTGVIGRPLPVEKINSAMDKVTAQLKPTIKAGSDFAKAIMTTDTTPKNAMTTLKIAGKQIKIAAATKGAGMIAPNMATTITCITTDAAISKSLLARALKAAVGQSLNKLIIDGHQSTNDTALILSSAMADNPPITAAGKDFDKFSAALLQLSMQIAHKLAQDAEGAARTFTVLVKNAATKPQAQKAARAVAGYPLFKCAVHGADPNWGRIIAAVGSSKVNLSPEKMTCKIGKILVFEKGTPVKFNRKRVAQIIQKKHHTVTVDLAAGSFSDYCLGCDLTKEYVAINADYHT